MNKITSNSSARGEETSLIRTRDLGTVRGIWATAGYMYGQFGITLGRRGGEDPSFAIFIPEQKFAEVLRRLEAMPPDYKAVFYEAMDRLPGFKAQAKKQFSL